MRLPGKRHFLLTTAVLIITGSAMATYWWVGPRLGGNSQVLPRMPLTANPQGEQARGTLRPGRNVSLGDARSVTGGTTWVEEHLVYQGCKDEEVTTRRVKTEEIGLTREEWGFRYPKATIVEFSRERVVTRVTRDGFCARHLNYRYLGIADGKVAIFAGPPGGSGRLLEVMPIKIEALPQAEVQDLKRGIPAATERELLELLQGLSSLESNLP